MKRRVLYGLLFLIFFGCERDSNKVEEYYTARIVGFDLNCATCILSFPDDSVKIKNVLGESPENKYQTVNLYNNNYVIGQSLKVKVRKAMKDELKACITLFPSYNYENIFVSDFDQFPDLRLNDTILMPLGDCLYDSENQNTLCFDSVVTDSRCPEDVVCIWEGEAIGKFSLRKYQQDPVIFKLKQGSKDTAINGYRISFVDLLPHRNSRIQTNPRNYKAVMIIHRQ